MAQKTLIRMARRDDLGLIEGLMNARVPDLVQREATDSPTLMLLRRLVDDDSLLLADIDGQVAGVIALDLMGQQLIACYLKPGLLDRAGARRLILAAEKLALSFGVRRLSLSVQAIAVRFMFALGYDLVGETGAPDQPVLLEKSLEDSAADWQQRVFALHRQLGISDHYGPRRRLRMIPDCSNLQSIGFDIYDREQFLHPEAAKAWQEMRDGAANAGVALQVVSAFRGRDYQAGLIQAKLDRGGRIDQILTVSAAPGFSEHHSGRALDLKAPGSAVLEEDFARTPAYRWLKANARYFGFQETLGPNNPHGIIWEPWHWCFRAGARSG
ncbi:MAG: GNAT family N-acetyltransferase [Wenzhouxiangella sp.]